MASLSDLSLKELRNLIEEQTQEIAEEDARMKADGYGFKITWWNHTTKGDDYEDASYLTIDPTKNLKISQKNLRAYIKQNPKSDMAKLLLKVKRQSRGDFRVIKL